MIIRALTLAGGLAGAGTLSQFPEFSQQYAQRLGGAVDALGQVVADFDASAQAEGLSRDAALGQMVGTDFIERRRHDMENTIARYDHLSEAMDALKEAGPFTRAYHGAFLTDRELITNTAQAFKPAVPLNFEGAVFGGAGFLGGMGILSGLFAVLRLPFRRRRAAL